MAIGREKNATDRLSGDQNGAKPPSAPGTLGSVEAISRTTS